MFQYANVGMKQLVGLMPSTKYMFRVQTACGSSLRGPLSSSSFFTTLGAECVPPTPLPASPIRSDRARLNWVKQSNALKYRIRWRQQGTSSWTVLLKDSMWNKHWLKPLAAATTYEWQIKTVCSKGVSSGSVWSSMQSFQTAPSMKMAEGATGVVPEPVVFIEGAV